MEDAGLPAEGSWPGVHHAPIGELVERDGQVRCHVCGWWGVGLFAHIAVHGLSADQYRAYFGLNTGTSLVPPSLARRGAYHGDGTMPDALREWNARVTPEQRALVIWGREPRAQSRRSGTRFDSRAQSLRAEIRATMMREQPAYRERVSIRARLAKRSDDAGRECPECGALFCTWTSRVGQTSVKARTCGTPECVRAARRRAARARWDA